MFVLAEVWKSELQPSVLGIGFCARRIEQTSEESVSFVDFIL